MERALIVETRRFMEDHRAELGGGDPELLAIAGVGAVRGAIVTLARERPAFLEDPDRVLDLATDLALGGLLAAQRRAGELG